MCQWHELDELKISKARRLSKPILSTWRGARRLGFMWGTATTIHKEAGGQVCKIAKVWIYIHYIHLEKEMVRALNVYGQRKTGIVWRHLNRELD